MDQILMEWHGELDDAAEIITNEMVEVLVELEGIVASSAWVGGPVAMDGDDGYLMAIQFRDKDKQPLESGYLAVRPHDGKEVAQVSLTIDL